MTNGLIGVQDLQERSIAVFDVFVSIPVLVNVVAPHKVHSITVLTLFPTLISLALFTVVPSFPFGQDDQRCIDIEGLFLRILVYTHQRD